MDGIAAKNAGTQSGLASIQKEGCFFPRYPNHQRNRLLHGEVCQICRGQGRFHKIVELLDDVELLDLLCERTDEVHRQRIRQAELCLCRQSARCA